ARPSTAPHATAVRRNGTFGTAGRRRRLRTSTTATGTATATTAAPLNGRDSEDTPAQSATAPTASPERTAGRTTTRPVSALLLRSHLSRAGDRLGVGAMLPVGATTCA